MIEKAEKKTKRVLRMDIVKIYAIIAVICTHFYYNTEFYVIDNKGPAMFVLQTIRQLFVICVPLFMISTGCLTRNKELKPGYFTKLMPTIITYILTSILYQFIVVMLVQHTSFNFWQFLSDLLSSNGSAYAWYIAMYVGIYLMTPFLNACYNLLQTKRDKLLAIGVLFCLSTLPSLNAYGYSIASTYWMGLYPITYYFVGLYFAEYREILPQKYAYILFALIFVTFGIVLYWKSNGHSFPFQYTDNNTVPIFLLSVLAFQILSHVNQLESTMAKRFIMSISKHTLGIYLLSAIFDVLIYKIVAQIFTRYLFKVLFAPLIVCTIFVLSFVSAYILEMGTEWLYKQIVRIPIFTKNEKSV